MIYIIYIYGDAKVGGIVVLSSIVREFAKVKPKTMKNYEKKHLKNYEKKVSEKL